MALDCIRGAWLTSNGQSNTVCSSNHTVAGSKHNRGNGCDGGNVNVVGASSHKDRKPLEPTKDQSRPASSLNRNYAFMTPVEGVPAAAIQGQGTREEGQPFSDTTQTTAVVPQTEPTEGPGLSDAGNSLLDNIKAGDTTATTIPASNTPKVFNSIPEDTPMPGSTLSKRSPFVQVLGYAVELDSASDKASVALVAEWPGIGSLHNLLAGKVQVAQRTFQEDLLRWTRQIAEALAQMSTGRCGRGGRAALTVSTRNAYLFPRPWHELRDGDDVLDVKVR